MTCFIWMHGYLDMSNAIFNGISENMHALDIRQKHRMKKNVADRMQCTVQGTKRIWPEVAECKGAKMNKRNRSPQGLKPRIPSKDAC